MGMDFNSVVFVGTNDEKVFKSLKKSVREELEVDGICDGGLQLWSNPYEEQFMFLGLGFELSNVGFEANLPIELDMKKAGPLVLKCIKAGIKDPKIYHFVYVW